MGCHRDQGLFEQKISGVPGFRIVVPLALSASGECYRLLPSLDLVPVTIRTAIERSTTELTPPDLTLQVSRTDRTMKLQEF